MTHTVEYLTKLDVNSVSADVNKQPKNHLPERMTIRAVINRIRLPMINCGLLIYCPHLSVSGQMGAWSWNHSYCNVEVFHFSYRRDAETNNFRNLISTFFSTDTSVVKFSQRSVW